MSTVGTTITRTKTWEAGPADRARTVDLQAPTSLADISCWRLLTARVPLTLLLDLALPSEELANLYEELLDEPSCLDWVPASRDHAPAQPR